MSVLPRAILFDLDDTLIRAYAQPEDAWRRLLTVFAAHLDAHDAEAIEGVRAAVMEEARAFWSDSQAAAKWRLDIAGARRLSVRRGLAKLGRADEALADRIADAFTKMRRDEYKLYPDAHATVDALRQAGVKLALVTNCAAETQRDKIVRFELRPGPLLRRHPDRRRVRPGQARARGLPSRAGAARRRCRRRLDGRRQLRMGSRGAAAPRHVRHLVRPLRGGRTGARHGQADPNHSAVG